MHSIQLFNKYGPNPPAILPATVPRAPLPQEMDSSIATQSNKALRARAHPLEVDGNRWDWSMMSVPEGMGVDDGYYEEDWDDDDDPDRWTTRFDESRCQGQIIYMIEEGLSKAHPVSYQAFART
jgi:hypothetical protein